MGFGLNGQEEEDGYFALGQGIAERVSLLVGDGRGLK